MRGGAPRCLVVGVAMKASRERELAGRGMFPRTPKDGVRFVAMDLALPLEPQGPFDVVLHKVRQCPPSESIYVMIRRAPQAPCIHGIVRAELGEHGYARLAWGTHRPPGSQRLSRPWPATSGPASYCVFPLAAFLILEKAMACDFRPSLLLRPPFACFSYFIQAHKGGATCPRSAAIAQASEMSRNGCEWQRAAGSPPEAQTVPWGCRRRTSSSRAALAVTRIAPRRGCWPCRRTWLRTPRRWS
jgi:Inositol 1,3,4-trisphosphate 5/6-kinase pre-ATP-grasp domain